MASFLRKIIYGRQDYSPLAKTILQQYGNDSIEFMEIQRSPLGLLQKVLNLFSLGRLEKNNPYDRLFHLKVVVRVRGVLISIEKNEVIKITPNPTTEKNTETRPVLLSRPFTINELLNNTRRKMGDDKFFSYSAYNNNCQDFILNMLEANHLSSSDSISFVKQDTKQLFNNLDYLRKFSNTLTDIAGRFDVIRQGGSLSQDNAMSSEDIIQFLNHRGCHINGVYSKDKLPTHLNRGWYVVNLQDHDAGNGTHWTCLNNLGNDILYFDSLGFYPPLDVCGKAKGDIHFSHKQIQDINSTACGYFCCAAILSKIDTPMKYERFLNHFNDDCQINDSVLFHMLQ